MPVKQPEKCPECGSTNFVWDRTRGEIHCKKCGTIVEEKLIDFSQEWREFDSEQGESKRRAGTPLSFTKHDLGLSTTIKASDLSGMKPSERKALMRMMKWGPRVSTPLERNLKIALTELKRVASFLDIPKTAEEDSAMIYRMAAQRGLVRGRSMESVVAGAIYAACRRHGVPRTLDEISQAFPLDKKEIGKTYRFICRELNIRILPTSSLDYIQRFASELKLTPKTVSKSIEIMKKANDLEITSGKGPMGIAAAALYVAALLVGEKKTQREVADVAGVTEVTIRNRYKELLEKLKLEDQIKKIKEKE